MVSIPHSVLLLGIVSLINDASSEMILPILPIYISSIGGGALAIGTIGSIADAIASLLKAFSGYLSDKFDSRKPLVVSGYGLSALSKTGYFLATTWPAVLFLRIGDRIGKGLRTAPRDAIIAAVAPRGIRGSAYGVQRALDSAGAILGSVLAFVFLYVVGLDIRTILMIAGPISFLTLIPLFFVQDVHSKRGKISGNFLAQVHKLPHMFKLSLVPVSLFYIGNFTYMFLVLRATQVLGVQGNGLAMTLGLYVWYHAFYTFSSYPLGSLSDAIGRVPVITLGYSLFALTCLGFSVASSFVHFLVLFALYGLFNATIEGNEKAFAVDLAPKARGTALGVFYATEGLMTLPSGFIAGYLWDAFSPQATFMFGTLMSAVAILALNILVKEK